MVLLCGVAAHAQHGQSAALEDEVAPIEEAVSDEPVVPDDMALPAETGVMDSPPEADATPSSTASPLTLTPAPDQATVAAPRTLLGAVVQPGTRRHLRWVAGQSFSGSPLRAPVVVVHGARPGPTLCLTGAVHGDELNGVEIIRRVLRDIVAEELRGTLIGVPIVNLLGFAEGSRYLPDRTDLNRFFPGHPRGNAASRIAYAFFEEVVRGCDRLVDLHTGSFKRSNLPQLRANLDHPELAEFVRHFAATAVLHRSRERGTLRDAATAAGIPAVTFELGEPGTVQAEHVAYGVATIHGLLDRLGMLPRPSVWTDGEQPIFYRARWARAVHGGILSSSVRLGAQVGADELLGLVINPLTNETSAIRAPFAGRVLGRALDQFVLPGFAVFHLGIETHSTAERDKGAPLPEETPGDDEEALAGGAHDEGVEAFMEESREESGAPHAP